MTRIAFAWPGLPDYAARCIREVIHRLGGSIPVVATHPAIPIRGMERSLGQKVNWVHSQKLDVSWLSLGIAVPEIFFCGGYHVTAFNSLAREVRAAGGRVVLMADNNWRGGLRQRMVESIRHRLLLRSRFDAIFVPGASAERVARSWGYDPQQTARGLYGADPALFQNGPSLNERPPRFLFVGQFIPRKNVTGLVEAFMGFVERYPNWTLSLCGDGPQAAGLPRHPQIEVLGFLQPPQLAERLRASRCLVLPSLEEHWGLVVHEAALSGCALALSSSVGAAQDLAQPENAVIFSPGDTRQLMRGLTALADWDDARWQTAEQTSRRLASRFGPQAFADGVEALVAQLTLRSI